jgi:hypothetical protein
MTDINAGTFFRLMQLPGSLSHCQGSWQFFLYIVINIERRMCSSTQS